MLFRYLYTIIIIVKCTICENVGYCEILPIGTKKRTKVSIF